MFYIILFALVGAVTGYALGYFRERKVVEPPEELPALPSEPDASLRALFESYGEEVRAKYSRNHARRRADKFLREFSLTTIHFVIFIAMTIACTHYPDFTFVRPALLMLIGLSYLTMALKAGQLTASKETVEHKERLLIHTTEEVNRTRKNVFQNCSSDRWIPAMQARDEQSFHIY